MRAVRAKILTLPYHVAVLATLQAVGPEIRSPGDPGRADRSFGGIVIQLRLARDLVVGVVGGDGFPLALDVSASSALEMARPGSVKFPVNLVRRGDFKGGATLVALSLPPCAAPQGPVTI